jgi:hypothetical protein
VLLSAELPLQVVLLSAELPLQVVLPLDRWQSVCSSWKYCDESEMKLRSAEEYRIAI